MNVSIYQNGFDKVGLPVPMKSVFHWIESGWWRTKISMLRTLRSINKEFYDVKKLSLPCVTFSGTFSGRADALLDTYSGYICLDVDNIDPFELKCELNGEEYIRAMFTSPSGEGLKIIVQINNESNFHQAAYFHLESYFMEKYSLIIDKSGKNISRLCFVSYDEKFYFNESSSVFEVDTEKFKIPEKVYVLGTPKEGEIEISEGLIKWCFDVTSMTEQYAEGNRNNYCHRIACLMNEKGIPQDMAIKLLVTRYGLIPIDCIVTIEKIYKRNNHKFGTVSHESREPKKVKLD